MTHKKPKWIRVLSSPLIVFYALPYLMVILVLGTLAQKNLGLYLSLKLFFYSPILWVGYVPVPGGASILALIFLNLLLKFLFYSDWSWKKLGINLAHFGTLLLLVGGIISGVTRQDSVVALYPNEPTSQSRDFIYSQFTILKNDDEVYVAEFDKIAVGDLFLGEDIPFQVKILDKCLYCDIVLRPEAEQDDGWIAPAHAMKLVEATPKKQAEENIQGLAFEISGLKEHAGKYLTFESFPKPPQIEVGEDTYSFVVERIAYTLPFQIMLTDFEAAYYEGSNTAEEYASTIALQDGDEVIEAYISMNKPLRYEGYTFYQTSYFDLPLKDNPEEKTQVSVLTVVKNQGRLFPYLSCLLIAFGLVLHMIMKPKVKRSGEGA